MSEYNATFEDLTKDAFHNLLKFLIKVELHMEAEEMIDFIRAGRDFLNKMIVKLGPCNHDVDHCICDIIEQREDLDDILSGADSYEASVIVVTQDG